MYRDVEPRSREQGSAPPRGQLSESSLRQEKSETPEDGNMGFTAAQAAPVARAIARAAPCSRAHHVARQIGGEMT